MEYVKAELEIYELEADDIIVTSGYEDELPEIKL